MPRDNFTLDYLAKEMAKCVRRDPEYRKAPGDRADATDPFRLVGIIDGHAVARRRGRAIAIFDLKEFDSWPLVDKNGAPVDGD